MSILCITNSAGKTWNLNVKLNSSSCCKLLPKIPVIRRSVTSNIHKSRFRHISFAEEHFFHLQEQNGFPQLETLCLACGCFAGVPRVDRFLFRFVIYLILLCKETVGSLIKTHSIWKELKQNFGFFGKYRQWLTLLVMATSFPLNLARSLENNAHVPEYVQYVFLKSTVVTFLWFVDSWEPRPISKS